MSIEPSDFIKKNDSAYVKLLEIRRELFPDFEINQEKATDAIYSIIEKHCELTNINRVCDIGCGTGEMLFNLEEKIKNKRTISFLGIDVCKHEIENAQHNAKKKEI